MITKVVEYGGTTCICFPDGFVCKRAEYYGKSIDSKPIEGVRNSDIFYEMDTRDVYLFDEEDKVWLKQ